MFDVIREECSIYGYHRNDRESLNHKMGVDRRYECVFRRTIKILNKILHFKYIPYVVIVELCKRIYYTTYYLIHY